LVTISCHGLHPRENHLSDRLVDRGLALEEAVDIGGRHLAGLGDVGDGGLAVAERAEQMLGLGQNPVADFGLCGGGAAH
jgi:hypothetical protein